MFSDQVLDHNTRPRNRGELPNADRFGVAGFPGEGPYVQIWLRTDGSKILGARYETNGCPSSIACASMLCELAIGRELDKMKLLEPEELILILGGLPEGKESYARLAIDAIRSVVEEN